jgi:hypothetical protein
MQSFPSLKKKIEEEESGLKARGSPASASSLDLRKVATSSTQRGNAIVTDEEGIKDSGGGPVGLRRRYSAGNLREHSEESEDNKHDGEDDTDGDHEMFSMYEPETPTPPTTTPTIPTTKPKELTSEKIVVPTYAQARQNWAERCYEIERSKRMVHQDTTASNVGMTSVPSPTITTPTIMPPPTEDKNNSNETTRTEWFLLIENLTKNMIRPCVLDLKMGTRQYG